jgi:EmrB/QacA subfamily drug resistance transporter
MSRALRDQGTGQARPGLLLALLCVANVTTISAIATINVAFLSIQDDLGVDSAAATWLISTYAIALGGFVLLGGRLADLFGRRRIFLIGLGVFAIGALGCGLSPSFWPLVAMRALQGLGAALTTPAGLSILTDTFREGRERHRALGMWAVSGSAGSAIGFSVGGIITDVLGWRWIFLCTVPMCVVVAVAAFVLVRGGTEGNHKRGLDVAGAVTVTAALTLLVFGLTESKNHGWISVVVLSSLGASALLLGAFVFIERVVAAPLVPLRVFRNRNLSAALFVVHIHTGLYLALVIFASLYMQRVLGFSPFLAGLGFLVQNVSAMSASTSSHLVVGRVGARRTLAAGLVLEGLAALWLGRAPIHGNFILDVVPALSLIGLGGATASVAANVIAFEGTPQGRAGLISGLMSTSSQVGSGLGVALLTSIAAARSSGLVGAGRTQLAAFAEGESFALHVAAGIAAAAAVIAVVLVRGGRTETASVAPRTLEAPLEVG